MKPAPVEFRFNTKVDQTILLGKKARNIQELYSGIRTTPDASIYFHTHKFLQQHHYLSPEPPNDFAYWAANEPSYARELGIKGKEHTKNNFLMTRQIKDYLLAFLSLIHNDDIVYL
jgi:hypothetical protein